MRAFTFLATLLAPTSAFACGWRYIDSAPAAYVVSGSMAACVVALIYQAKSSEAKSWAPEALAIACLIAGFGMGVVFGVGDWNLKAASFGAAPIVLPYLAMKTRRRVITTVLLLVLGAVTGLMTYGAFQGKKVSGFTPASDEVLQQVTF